MNLLRGQQVAEHGTITHGVVMFQTDESMSVPDLAVEAEARGLDSVWCVEHTHIPASRQSPFPLGGELPQHYYRTLDPLLALAAAAQVTMQIRLGTGVCLVAQHDPILLAKQVATLDHLSGGRVVLGIGYGWNLEEAANHGVPAKSRRAIAHENVAAMKALWTQERASFDGEHVRFDDVYMWPKPVQQGGPPVLLGAGGSSAIEAAVRFADGWLPIGGSGLQERLYRMRQAAERVGRDPDSVSVSVYGARPDKGKVEYYRSLGVSGVIYGLPSACRDVVLRSLDRCAAVASSEGA